MFTAASATRSFSRGTRRPNELVTCVGVAFTVGMTSAYTQRESSTYRHKERTQGPISEVTGQTVWQRLWKDKDATFLRNRTKVLKDVRVCVRVFYVCVCVCMCVCVCVCVCSVCVCVCD